MGKHIGFNISDEEEILLEKIKNETGKNQTEVFRNVLYFTGIDEDFVDEIMSNISFYASDGNMDGVKEEVHRYVVYRAQK